MSKANPGRGSGNEIGSWVFTIFMLWAFFPLGVILLIIQLKKAMSGRGRERGQWKPVPVQQRGGAQPQRPVREPEPQARGQARRVPARSGGGMFAVGAILLLFGVYQMAEPVSWLFELGYSSYDLREALKWGAVALGGGVMVFIAWQGQRRERQYANYLAVIGESQCLSIEFIASATGRKYAAVARDLQAMINQGYFEEDSYLDLAERCFVASHEYAPRRDVRPAVQQPGPEPQPETPGADELARLMKVRQSIKNPSVSAGICRLEELARRIFDYAAQHPEKKDRLRRFSSHYLPRTVKICEAYARLESQGVQGENIRTAMREVEEVMDSLVQGFENQLDALFGDEALDITTDVSVLENMMSQGGLRIGDFVREETGQ